ncbi:MAG: arginine--tRNA ligase [Defluviitaleaceae bacterium]|nr:arginine--tRNA ligase [Defluviitaleaceae bacterium]
MDYKLEISKLLDNVTNISIEEIYKNIEIPDRKLGDFAFPCFKLAKEQKKSPAVISKEIAESIKNKPYFFEKIINTGPYINFYIDKFDLAEKVLTECLEKGIKYGSETLDNTKNIVIDYSSPNIAKPFHVGHLRSTVIGRALYNIYSFLGYKPIGVNHLGDWGTQFGKLICAYKMWSTKEDITKGGIEELNKLYVRFHKEAKNNPELNDIARNYLLKMEEGDEEILKIWNFFNEISLIEFEKVYSKLNIKFDYFTGESFYQDKMEPVLKELENKNLIEISENAKIVNLDEYDLPPCLVLRSDGGTLYHTRDLATAFYRKKEFNFYKVIYVTGLDQSLHFKQLFKVIEKMGYEWSKDMEHIAFGLVSLPTGKLSTREGNVVLMEDLIDDVVDKAESIIQEKNPTLENREKVAKQIGVGAIVFNDLYNTRIKDVVFSFEKMLNFDGETGPFVQYSYVRANSLIEKAGDVSFENIDFSVLDDEYSQNLLYNIYFFKEKLQDVIEKNEPYILTRHIVQIAQNFNRFYSENPILTSPEHEKIARLAIVYATKNVIQIGLNLLGIETPEKM